MEQGMLYAGYGSNLNKAQMEERCPDSDIVATKVLKGWRLCFRGVADIVPEKGLFVNLGIYKISAKCENALDFYEDFPNLYRKEYLEFDEFDEHVFTYIMNPGYGYGPPSKQYFNTIQQGYDDWELEWSPLIEAARNALIQPENSAYKSTRWNSSDVVTEEYLSKL